MTITDFRRNPLLVARMREIMADPAFAEAIAALRESNPAIDADPKDDPIVSVRILSQMVGYNTYAQALALLTEPLQQPIELSAEYKPEV